MESGAFIQPNTSYQSSGPPKRPHIPPELWIDIIDCLRIPSTTWFRSPSVPKPPDVKSLTPLLTVSKTISRITEPFLYEWVVLSIDEETESLRHQLLSSLATRPHTLDLVKYLVIEKPYSYCKVGVRASTVNKVRHLFPALKNLRGIFIDNMSVPSYVTTDLHLLQKLEVFELFGSILEDIDGAPAAIGDGLPLTRLITLLLGTSLETLQIGPDYINAFLASLTPSSTITFNQLQTLRTDIPIGSSSYFELFEMLQLCPSITTLIVCNPPFEDCPKEVDPPGVDVVRHLQTLEAPSNLASLLVPDRPIRSLSLRNHGSLNEPGLEWLTKSTAPLTSLCLQVMVEGMLGDISRIFPSLEELSFNLNGGDTYDPWSVEQLAPLKNLRTLTFRHGMVPADPLFVGGDSAEVQSAMMITLDGNHPSLVFVVLGNEIEWKKHPENGQWTHAKTFAC